MPKSRLHRQKKHRGPSLATVLILALCLLAPGDSALPQEHSPQRISLSPEEQAWVKAHPVIRIAPDPGYPPFEMRDERGVFTGISADLLHLALERLGLRSETVPSSSWSESLDKLRRRETDLLPCAALTKERQQYANFTRPYLEVRDVLIVRSQVDGQVTMADLRQKTVATVKGWAANDFLMEQHPDVRLKLVPDVRTGLQEVSFGTVDAMTVALATASYWLERTQITNLRVAGESGFVYDYRFAARKDWPELSRLLDKSLASISKEEREAAYEKWITLTTPPWRPSRRLLTILAAVLLTLIISGVLLWNYSLRSRVRTQTKTLRKELAERKRSQEERRLTESRYRTLFETSRDGLASVALDGRIEHVNPAFLDIIGYSLDEARALSYQDLTPEKWHRMNEEIIQNEVIARGRSRAYEKEYIRKDGTTVPIEVLAWTVRDEHGAPERLMAIVRDITDRKKAEEERRGHVHFLESLERVNRVATAAIDTKSMLEAVLDEVIDIFATDRAFLLCPCDPQATVCEVPAERARKEYPGAFAQGVQVPVTPHMRQFFELLLEHEEALGWTWSAGACPWDPENRFGVQAQMSVCVRPRIGPPWCFGVHQCSSERVWIDEERLLFQQIGQRLADGLSSLLFLQNLQESERKYRTLFDSTTAGLLVFDSNFHMIEMNPAALKLFACATVEEFLAQPPGSFSPKFQPDGKTTAEKAREVLAVTLEKGAHSFEWTCRRANGEEFFAAVLMTKVQVGGELLVQASIRDITDQKRAEMALQESESKYRTLFDSATDGLLVCDSAFNLIAGNPSALKLFRCQTEEEFLGHSPARFSAERQPDGRSSEEKAKAMMNIAFEKGSHSFEWLHKRADGEEFFAAVVLTRMEMAGELFVQGAVRDITDQKRAEMALQESEAKYRGVVDNTGAAIVHLSLDGSIEFLNKTAQKGLRRRAQELLGRSIYEVLPAKADVLRERLRTVKATGQGQVYDDTIELKGVTRELTSTFHPLRNAEDILVGVQVFSQDVTERRHAEKEAQRLRNLLRNILDSMPSILVGVDEEGRIVQWNKEAEKATGTPAEEARDRPLTEVFPELSEQMTRVNDAIRTRSIQHQGRIASEAEGETRYHDLTVYPLVADDMEGAVIRLDDVTTRVRIEEMMVQSEKMMTVGGLAAGMAHEINNPLAGILQNIQVVRNRLTGGSPKNEEAAQRSGATMEMIRGYMERRSIYQMLDAVSDSGQRAARIVENMLEFSRKSESQFTRHDVTALLDRTIDLAQNDYDLKKRYDFRQIEILRHYDEDAPEVQCDPTQIQQVFLNILKNGAEALADKAEAKRAEEGKAHAQGLSGFQPQFVLSIRRKESMVCVEIADNGPGLPEGVRKRIFEPFFTTKPVGRGTGLGLSVSYFIIVENHRGDMSAESVQGEGTRFTIRLPIERSL